jgi:hypothetical protein
MGGGLSASVLFLDLFFGRYPRRLAAASGRVLAGYRPRPCFAAGGSAR